MMMHKFKIMLVFLLLFFLTGKELSAYPALVVGISDGDTVTVLCKDDERKKIRLYGVDCPESRQDFGGSAKKYTSTLIFGKEVEVLEKSLDRYGRTVAKIFISGDDLSLKLIENGLAWHYKRYSSDIEYSRAEDSARRDNKGLWSRKNSIAPWEFRKLKKRTGGKK